MKTLKRLIALLVLFAGLSSCASLFVNKNVLMNIHNGMSQSEVSKLLGQPDYRRFNGDLEEWEYDKGIWGNAGNTVIVVGFADGRVVNMDSFSSVTPPAATASSSVEINNRPINERYPSDRNHRNFFLKKMDQNAFDTFYSKVKTKTFADDKLELIKLKAADYSFSCKQCIKMMSLFTFDDEKMKVLEPLASGINDKENYDNVISELDYISSKEKAKRLLGIE